MSGRHTARRTCDVVGVRRDGEQAAAGLARPAGVPRRRSSTRCPPRRRRRSPRDASVAGDAVADVVDPDPGLDPAHAVDEQHRAGGATARRADRAPLVGGKFDIDVDLARTTRPGPPRAPGWCRRSDPSRRREKLIPAAAAGRSDRHVGPRSYRLPDDAGRPAVAVAPRTAPGPVRRARQRG